MSSDRAKQPLALLAGIGLGAALMYVLDPKRGARRRHRAIDRATSALRRSGRDLRDTAVNVRNHAAGAAAELRGRMRAEAVDDEQLVARVWAELGHHAQHTGGIDIVARDGCVTLRGPALEDEADAILETVAGVRGVCSVDNQLDVRTKPGRTPSLQS